MPGIRIDDLVKTDEGRILIAISGAGLKRLPADKLEPILFTAQSIEMRCFRTGRSIRINCCVTAMEVSGSEPTNGGSSIYITAGQTYSRNQMVFQATSFAVFSRTVKAMSGSPLEGLDRFRELPVSTISIRSGFVQQLLTL